MRDVQQKVVICGGGGFIGGHLADDLIRKGFKHIRVVDVKPKSDWYQVHPEAENIIADMNLRGAAFDAVRARDGALNSPSNRAGMGSIRLTKVWALSAWLSNRTAPLG